MYRRSRASKVVYFVDFDIQRKGDVKAHQLKTFIIQQVGYVILRARKEIVDAQNVMSLVNESFAQMRSKKPGSAGDKNFFHLVRPFTK